MFVISKFSKLYFLEKIPWSNFLLTFSYTAPANSNVPSVNPPPFVCCKPTILSNAVSLPTGGAGGYRNFFLAIN